MGEESLVSRFHRGVRWRTSFLANAFSPSKAFMEPLSSSTRAKSIGVAQGGLGDGGAGGGGGNRCGTALKAKSIGNHCGGHESEWLTSTRLLATLVFVMCGMEAVQMAATTPMRSARKLEAYLFAYTLRWGGLEGTLQGQDARYPGTRQSSRKRVAQLIAASLRPGSSGGVAA